MAGKKAAKKRSNINFRQTHSERSATNSYRSFGKYRLVNVKTQISNVKSKTF